MNMPARRRVSGGWAMAATLAVAAGAALALVALVGRHRVVAAATISQMSST
jgi:hypothetical protein